MKLRLNGNSIRFRLSVNDVTTLGQFGKIIETTTIPPNMLSYELHVMPAHSVIATFSLNRIVVVIPRDEFQGWARGNEVGIEVTQRVEENSFLHILIEKDFECLDASSEPGVKFFPNPNRVCDPQR